MLNIKTVFGDHDTAVVELKLSHLSRLVYSLFGVADDPELDEIVWRYRAALLDNEIQDRREWFLVQMEENKGDYEAIQDIARAFAQQFFVDNANDLSLVQLPEAGANRSPLLGSLLNHALNVACSKSTAQALSIGGTNDGLCNLQQ